MPFGSSDAQAGPTPGRITTLTLDVPETVLVEPGLNALRRGSDISLGSSEGVGAQLVGVKYWSSGAYSFAPIQEDISNIYEGSDGQSSILQASDFSLLQLNDHAGTPAPAVVTRKNQIQAPLTGSAYAASVSASGDPFLHKVFPAGGSVDPSLVPANSALVANGLSPVLPNATSPMDRTGLSTATFPQDAPFFIRWSTEGSPHDYPMYTHTVGFGQYAVVFTGDGKALLYENCHDSGGTLRWVRRAKWRYSSPKQVMKTSHTLALWPHIGPNAKSKFIAFGNNQLDVAQEINTGFKANSKNVAAHEYVYRADSAVRGQDVDEAGAGHVTTAGPVWWDTRRDLRVKIQISKFAWAKSGTLIDFAHSVGTAVGNANPVSLTMAKVTPPGCTLTGVVKDAKTQAAFVPGTDSQPYPEFTFSGDGTNTPILYAYRLRQDPVTQAVAPGAFSVDLDRVSISGYSGDPSEESASVGAYDLGAVHTRLTKRGRFSAMLTTTDPVVGTVVLFRGYAVRPSSRVMAGGLPAGFNGRGAGQSYPAAGWRSYEIPLMGMYMRLAEKVTPNFGIFGQDPASSTYLPMKVTDVIRRLLLFCGFTSAQVDIPDLSVRLWPGNSNSIDDQVIQPGADIADCILRLTRNYLGAYLWWNPNNGSSGKWQLLFGTQPASDGTFTPVYNFVTSGPPQSARTVPTHPGAYPPLTTFIDGGPEFETIPPAYNTVVVSTDSPLTGTNTRLKSVAYAYNFLSFPVPGSTVTSNPEHPDYIGYCLPLEIIDPCLEGDTDADTWAAVAWTARRAYDFYCHAQALVRFSAPLVLIRDAGLGQYRPLRFQDPISIDGDSSWLIKAVHPRFTKSHVQMAEYEAIAPMPGQYFMGTDGLHFKRYAQDRLAQKATGHGTHSNHWGLLSVTAAEEQKRLALPLNNQYQVPLQNLDGSFIPIQGYSSATGGPG